MYLRIHMPREDIGQPAYPSNLIRVFIRHSVNSQGSKASSFGEQRRLRSDCANAQSDLSLRWEHMP